MKTSPQGRKFIELHEGIRLKAYKDIAGIWTIGVGHTSRAGAPQVTPDLTITANQADAILEADLAKFERAVLGVLTTTPTQPQFDAMVSLCFNIGPAAFTNSSVVRYYNAGDLARAAASFALWNKVRQNGVLVPIQGLTNRRRDEATLFSSKIPTNDATARVVITPANGPAEVQKPLGTNVAGFENPLIVFLRAIVLVLSQIFKKG